MKNIEKVKISTEFIKLDQFLKWLAVVDSGSDAKQVILDGKVKVNDEVETRRGRKIYPEYKVEIFDKKIRNEIEEKALGKIKKEIDNSNIDVILNVKKFSKTMYYKMIGATIMEILKSEYQEMLEDSNRNDK